MRQLKITQSITNRDSITLEKYFNEIAREQLLTPEEEVNLARRIQEGDEKALEKLVRANLRFVISVAKQYQHTKVPLCDLISEGNLGLIKAAKKFDETKGFKFISYAVWWIRQSILQYLAENSRLIRLPANKIGALSKLNQAAETLEQKFEREPTEEELAEVLETELRQIKVTLNSLTKSMSVDKPLTSEDSNTLLDVLENENANTVEKQLIHSNSLKKEITRLLSTLTWKESEVVKLFFGIDDDKSLSLDDIGIHLGISRERVRQIKSRAIRKLSSGPRAKLLAAYLA